MKQGIFLFLFFILLAECPYRSFSQIPEYPQIFGDDWKKAEEFVESNKEWIAPQLKKYDIDYYEAVAVVFPELIRYSALRDKMEITLLKALYINLGKDYANFSIGQFQMKPYFAEKIRETAYEAIGRKSRSLVRDSTAFENMRQYRASIVEDLESTRQQINYLIIFFRICYKKFDLKSMDERTRIRFLSTAYNYGFYHDKADIDKMTEKKFFSAKLISSVNYSYSGISLYWYNLQHRD